VLTLGSLSKTHAMTGWRAGWVVGPEDFIAHAEQLALNMLYGLPGFVQEAAQKALEIAAEAEAKVRDYCALRRERFYRALEGLPGVRPCWPDAGMFMLLDVRATGLAAGDFVRGLYQAERVSLLDGAAFGRATEGFVRACFAAELAELDEAARRIRRYAASLGTR
jgi:arginine:pyruvate transaminase